MMASHCDIDMDSYASEHYDYSQHALQTANSTYSQVAKFSRNALKPASVVKSTNSDSSLCLSTENSKMAGMKIFATIMLSAWRRRRAECKILSNQTEELKDLLMKTENQSIVYKSLCRVEKKRTDELSSNLKRCMDSNNEAKLSCETLTNSLLALKASHAKLEEELRIKEQEQKELSVLLAESKSENYRAMIEQKTLKTSLAKEQRNAQFSENQKNKLINEVYELNEESRKSDERYQKELGKKCIELSQAKEKEAKLLADIDEWKDKFLQVNVKRTEEDFLMRTEVQVLRIRCNMLEEELGQTLGAHVKDYWQKLCRYQEPILKAAYILAHCILPAMPSPTFQFAIRLPWLDSVMN